MHILSVQFVLTTTWMEESGSSNRLVPGRFHCVPRSHHYLKFHFFSIFFARFLVSSDREENGEMLKMQMM